MFAPYDEMYAGGSVAAIARSSGARYFTLAFVESTGPDACDLTPWGDADSIIADIAALRALGGDVVPSFGGYSADTNGNEVGDSCSDPDALVATYEELIRTFGVTRIDMDIEEASLGRTDAISRRNAALARVQRWADDNGGRVEVQYTLPTSPDGLDRDALAVLADAARQGVRLDVVNPMVFDYYDGSTTDMAAAAKRALTALHHQLAALLPASDADLWTHEAATLMIGIDDYPKKSERTTLADARSVLAFARAKGMAGLSFWAIQRDNGRCPGTAGADNCSGLSQPDWAFTKALVPFTGP